MYMHIIKLITFRVMSIIPNRIVGNFGKVFNLGNNLGQFEEVFIKFKTAHGMALVSYVLTLH